MNILNSRKNAQLVICFLLFCVVQSKALKAQQEFDKPFTHTIKAPKTVSTGEQFLISVVFDMKKPWYIYAPTGNNAALGMIETKILYKLPKGISSQGNQALPEYQLDGPYEIYRGKGVTFSQNLKIDDNLAPGSYEIKTRIYYQMCNGEVCLPPKVRESSKYVDVITP